MCGRRGGNALATDFTLLRFGINSVLSGTELSLVTIQGLSIFSEIADPLYVCYTLHVWSKNVSVASWF